MIRVAIDGSLNQGVSALFHPEFQLTPYHDEQDLAALIVKQDILLCRSKLKVNQALLAQSNLKCVATASSGTDHIDGEYLNKKHIKLLDAKGSKARSVADYVLSCLAYLNMSKTLLGTRIGIIGLGAVGTQVQARLRSMGFEVLGYDPLRAESEPGFESVSFEQVLQADVLCLHANLHDGPKHSSRNLINAKSLSMMRPGAVILNAARGGLVDEQALLSHGDHLSYCTDVYDHEPDISEKLIQFARLCTPHIAGHSIEGRKAMLTMAIEKIHRYFGLAMPMNSDPHPLIKPPIASFLNWQQLLLGLYNPELETKALKQANNLRETFLSLRQAHGLRHDFSVYTIQASMEFIQAALGRDCRF